MNAYLTDFSATAIQQIVLETIKELAGIAMNWRRQSAINR
jgi:hypothetical protein